MNPVIFSLSAADERLLLAVLERRRPALDLAMRWITGLGSWYTVIPLTLALAYGVVPGVQGAGRVALVALAVSHLFVQLLKRTVCRERPAMPVGLGFLIEPEDRFSFPSGHAAAGLSVGLPFLLLAGTGVGLGMMLLGALVGVSRCYLGVHYPSDVAMGWLLATVSVVATLLLGVPV